MSIILSGLIHVFQPLLSSLSGALDCEGLVPWYFLLGLRIVAIFFSNGPWDTIKEDVACNWVHPMHERSQDFCTALCHNQHFPISVSATWGLVFIVLLLLVGLMKLSSPPKKKDDHRHSDDRDKDRDRDRDRLAIVAVAPHRSSADISTIYTVGPHGLTENSSRYSRSRHPGPPYRAPGTDWYGPPVAFGPGAPDPDVEAGPSEFGGYGMPAYSRPIGDPRMPDQSYNMTQRKMSMCPTGRKQTKSALQCPGADEYEMSILHDRMGQANLAPPYDETAQYMPTKCAPVPVHSSSYKGCVPPQCWPGDGCNEPVQPRYMDPDECGIPEPPDSSSTACMYPRGNPTRYPGRCKMAPNYGEGGRYGMATKCRPVPKCNMDSTAVPHWEDDKANVAIKRRPVAGSKMPTKRQVTFDATGSSEMGFGSNAYPQPWLAGSCPMPDNGTCAETDPCCMDTRCGPPCEPSGGEEAVPTSGNDTTPGESAPGPQDHATMSISRICGIPLFDLWVGLLLATEIGFLLAIILLQMPRLVGRTWICVPGATSCPQSVECAVRGRAEKRVALWGLAFTSILFLIGCSGYFNLRMCWNQRCRRTCARREEEREEVCAADTEPEGRVFRGDVEGCNGEGRGEE
ncbi:hypothetical protein lerEdw1_009279 [Lerista edwardsae]|nr:hypothetical protein lerEdw1_009279 [Lerista edwardsae]